MENNETVSYSYRHNGVTIRSKLMFNPVEDGWKLVSYKDCCMHFQKDDNLIRIKTKTQIIAFEKVGKNRMLGSHIHPIHNHQRFVEIVNKIYYD